MLRATVAFLVADADACSFHSIWEASFLFTPDEKAGTVVAL